MMLSFDQRKRDPFLLEETYTELDDGYRRLVPSTTFPADRGMMQAKSPDHAWQKSFYRASNIFENVWIDYSAGEPVEAIRAKVPLMFEDFRLHFEAIPDDVFGLNQPDGYYYVMTWLSWAVLFNMRQYVPLISTFIDHTPRRGQDPFVHAIFAMLGVNDFPGKEAALLHPKPYAILYESLRGSKETQQASIEQYLRSWYKSMRNCYWHDRHKRAQHVHLGYWAFEAGMLTVLNDLDDSSYRDLNFYPRDLVDGFRAKGTHS